MSDVGAFLFVLIMIPVTYIYEVNLVLPNLYQDSYFGWVCHNMMGAFLLINLVGNFLGLWLTDTSTRFVVLPSAIHVRPFFKQYMMKTLIFAFYRAQNGNYAWFVKL